MRVSCLLLAGLLPFGGLAAERYQVLEDRAKGPGAPPLVVLRDDIAGVEAAIAPAKGGELSSLRLRHKGRWIETLYLARDYTPREGWTGKALTDYSPIQAAREVGRLHSWQVRSDSIPCGTWA